MPCTVGNYFGTTNTATIEAMILDRNDSLSRATVIAYQPALSALSPSAPSYDYASPAISDAVIALPPQQNNGWVITASATSRPAPQGLSDLITLPFGVTEVRLNHGTPGSSATLTIQYPAAIPDGAIYMKFGRRPFGEFCRTNCNQPQWYELPTAQYQIAPDRKSVTLTLIDGGIGDDDMFINGSISDPGGPAVVKAIAGATPTPVPVGSPAMWLMMALGLLVLARSALLRTAPR
jgi:hypothetical protein